MPAASSLRAEAELGELAHRVRQQVDADAERLQLGRGVDQLRLDARRVQAERGGQARDPGARDEDTHRTTLHVKDEPRRPG